MYGLNFSPELTGIGKYTGEMARWLAEQGHEIVVVTAPPYYPDWKVWPNFSKLTYHKEVEKSLTVWRCPLYVPKNPSAINRLLHLASFAFSSLPIVLSQIFWRPKLLILVVPTLFCAIQAILTARLSGAKSILHIQDYEVDALFGLELLHPGLVKRTALALESFFLKNFNYVSSISTAMLNRAISKGVCPDKLLLLPNWSELDRFSCVKFSADILNSLGVKEGCRVLLYSGNIGEKQGLELVLLTAQQFEHRKDVIFLIVGEGATKDRLMEMAKSLHLSNVIFAPLQSYENLPTLLACADVHLVIQKHAAADAVLPSKLTNIFAVGGNAIITAKADTSLGMLCAEIPGIATLIDPESVQALVEGINQALECSRPNLIASQYAKKNLDKNVILQTFFDELHRFKGLK
ncbi:glycosyltransferase WbuB [Polynucleobacter wuianus]|uniref:glycosyltransferase WbuB n=1 Tax=Polynucleobacter TaxID=44013 RepID=UPI002934183C|nr:glycosyltransferase WbuB [Polynucleobacter wuianus]